MHKVTLGKQVASASAPVKRADDTTLQPVGPLLPNLSSDVPTLTASRRDESPELYFEVLQLQSMRWVLFCWVPSRFCQFAPRELSRVRAATGGPNTDFR